MNRRGKEICEQLRDIRRTVAEKYGLNYSPRECHHEGNCFGTCPICDAELEDLQRQLMEKGIDNINLSDKCREKFRFLNRNNVDMDPSIDDPSLIEGDQGDIYPLEGDITPGVPVFEVNHVHLLTTSNRKLLKTCRVAGLHFHDALEFVEELSEGDRLFLIREPHNEHDSNAVAVAFSDDYDEDTVIPDEFSVLGYVPKSQNTDIATMIDMGWAGILDCEVSKVRSNGNPADRLEISIYIKNNATSSGKSNQLRAMMIGEDEFCDIQKSLIMKGYVYFRWTSTPTSDHNLPNKGELVVAINRRSKSALLMKVIATGSNVAPTYVSIDDVDMKDDCAPFILTLVSGPVAINDEQFDSIFDDEPDLGSQPEARLSRISSDMLKWLMGQPWRETYGRMDSTISRR